MSFNISGASATIANAINDGGMIAGRFADHNGVYHASIRAAGGSITTFRHRGATGTAPAGINTNGWHQREMEIPCWRGAVSEVSLPGEAGEADDLFPDPAILPSLHFQRRDEDNGIWTSVQLRQ